jgi:hypothetical protein
MATAVMICLLCATALFGQFDGVDSVKAASHPRLLLGPHDEGQIKTSIAKDTVWRNVHNSILAECDTILLLQPVERKMIGRRLLQVSRESLRRIFFLSYGWRMTQKKKYFQRCEEELLAISKFENWNPDHFLDVAEMTMAAAIGYDWLYNGLSARSRKQISQAIIEKGLNPSLESKYNGWLRSKNNWNQVCNGGITFGAIAVYEEQPALAQQLIKRAMNSITIPMKEYEASGNYNEGYSYWGYGTSFNVLFISALEKFLQTDPGLSSKPGFLETARFYEHLTGPSGEPFNYSDCGGIEGLQPAMFWFAGKLNDPSVLYVEKDYLLRSKFNARTNRLLPAALIWGQGAEIDSMQAPASNTWAGRSDNQVVMMRTSWKKDPAIFVGFKGGSPSISHGHMDAGSFVMDAQGVRWSMDLGMQQYNSLESAGLNIWNMDQASQRWQVFRYSNASHSTLTVNGHLQNTKGRGVLISSSDDAANTRAVIDISSLYNEDLLQAKRGIAIINKEYVTVRDEIETGRQPCTIRWAMLTPAKIDAVNGNQVQLTNKGKRLTLYVTGIPDAVIQTWRTDPPNSYDALNPGTALVGFEIKVPAATKIAFNVLLVPGEGGHAIKRSDLKPLNDW